MKTMAPASACSERKVCGIDTNDTDKDEITQTCLSTDVSTNDSSSHPASIPKTIIISRELTAEEPQSRTDRTTQRDWSSKADTVRSGVYYDNIEILRPIHPLQVGGSLKDGKKVDMTKKNGCWLIGRPLPPAPSLVRGGYGIPLKSNQHPRRQPRHRHSKEAISQLRAAAVGTIISDNTNIQWKKTSIISKNMQVEGHVVGNSSSMRKPTECSLSTDEMLFVEAASALAHGTPMKEEEDEPQQQRQNQPKNLNPLHHFIGTSSPLLVSSGMNAKVSPLAPPPFVLVCNGSREL